MLTPRALSALALSLIFAACAPRPSRPPVAPVESPAAAMEPAIPAAGAAPQLALVLRPHPRGLRELAAFLEENPGLRLTLLPPDAAAFEAHGGSVTAQRYRVLLSSKQIEIALTLENEPILPLLGDLRLAGEKAARWGFDFRWPEDISTQLARAVGRHQRFWGKMPSGLLPPYRALSPAVLEAARRFRLMWALARPLEAWGVRAHEGLFVVAPPALPDTTSLQEGSDEWADRLALWTLSYPVVHVDAASWSRPQHQISYLTSLMAQARERRPNLSFATLETFLPAMGGLYGLPPAASPFDIDYSSWVATFQQRRAWRALSEARSVLDAYKNSGRARLNRLDAATEEMALAESGPFLLSLGRPGGADPTSERVFLATIANVYRLTGTPVPPDLNNWFAYRGGARVPRTAEAENDRPFFVEGPRSYVWNDPKGDDAGPDRAVYPVGAYPKGAFDLRDFEIAWTDSDVTFTINLVNLPAPQTVAVAPLVDVYVDVNRLPDAGGVDLLPDRGRGQITREAAWEYAVTASPFTSVLWQSLPGGDRRRLQARPVRRSGNALSATFPRAALRGDPARWRLTVLLLGTENSRKNEALAPVPVLDAAGERNFGGAAGPRGATPIIDLLAPTAEMQDEVLQGLHARGRGTLPYVEAPAP